MAVAVKAVKAVKEHKQGCKSHDLWPQMPENLRLESKYLLWGHKFTTIY